MSHDHAAHNEHDGPPGFWRSRYAVGFLLIGAVAAYFLLTEHLAHVVGALPFLLLLACPVMHVFMHHGHGGHGQHHHSADSSGTGSAPQQNQRQTDPEKTGAQP